MRDEEHIFQPVHAEDQRARTEPASPIPPAEPPEERLESPQHVSGGIPTSKARRQASHEMLARRQRTTAIETSSSFDMPRPTQIRLLAVRMRCLAFGKLYRTVGSLGAERGGAFVGKDPFEVEDFIFDEASNHAAAIYYPNAAYLNHIIERDYEPNGRCFIGIGHSHPVGLWYPSGDETWGDVKAARNNLLAKGNAHLKGLFIPIIESEANTGRFKIYPFVMLREDFRIHTARLEIID